MGNRQEMETVWQIIGKCPIYIERHLASAGDRMSIRTDKDLIGYDEVVRGIYYSEEDCMDRVGLFHLRENEELEVKKIWRKKS